MRWMRSSGILLAPKVDYIFWALHGLTLTVLTVWLAFVWSEVAAVRVAAVTALVVLGLMAGAFAFLRRPGARFDTMFWPILALDLFAIGWFIYFSGGIANNQYLLFFALIPFVGYHYGLRTGLALAAVVSVAYLLICVTVNGSGVLPAFVFRSIMLGLFTAAMGYSAMFIRQSEERLLNAMDKLNERTTELEKTHYQLQTIYETSRSLAELLAEGDVIDRVLFIARSVLNYPVCDVYTWDDVQGKLWLKGRLDHEQTARYEKPQTVVPNAIMRQAIEEGEIRRVLNRHPGRMVIDEHPNRSQLFVPMISQGKVIGLLAAESPRVNAFTERDERVISVLAASTAMALVNADLHRRMEMLTIVDELTGAYNYRYFRLRLEDEKRRAVRYSQPLSLIMVDIDWFKHLNDHYGHETGNIALRGLAQVIASCIRDVDVLARYGGEEFIVILPQTGRDEAKALAERMRRRVEQTDFGPDPQGRPMHMTISVGITSYPDNGRPEDELVESVDRALYHAKGNGRNVVCTS